VRHTRFDLTFKELGIELEWIGKDEDENGRVKTIYNEKLKMIKSEIQNKHPFSLGDVVVEVSPGYYRPTEVDLLIGDASKAKKFLGWEAKVKFEELVKLMVKSDFEKVVKRGY
jgi:GDPmannose 4,6-dehydratase